MANQITVSDSGTVQVAIQQLGDVQVQISRTAIGGGISGYSGYSGASGLSGMAGSFSASGFSGFSGTSGYSGATGPAGSSGVSGFSGANGSAGASGTSGYSGATGPNGTSGISGYSGANGSAGASGVSGYSGANGSAGASGVSGFSGANGAAGASGVSGYSGATGPQGVSGFSGMSGSAGAGGAQGHYGAFFDITDQAGSLTEQVVAIGSTSTASGINLSGTGTIVLQTPGVYQLTYSIQLVNIDNAIHYADIYLKYNGSVYPDSNTRFFIPARKNSSEYGYAVATVDFIGIAANANDTVELYWITDDATNVSIETIPAAGTTPRTPGVIVNVSQVMYTQSGYSGYSGAAGASGVSGFSGAPGPASPGGSNTNVQYNDANTLAGSNAFTFNNTTNTLSVTNITGTLTTNAQPNITSTGNLVSLTVRDSANNSGSINQFLPNSIAINNPSTQNAAFIVNTQYWPNAGTNYPSSSTIRSRGNAVTPTTAVNGDRIATQRYYVYNGNVNVLTAQESVTLVSGTTLNGNSDQTFAGGQWNLLTINPAVGNTVLANANATSSQNQLVLTNSGALVITQGTAPNTSLGQSTTAISITNYGLATTDLVRAGGILQQKARGSRDGNLSVQAGDQIGRFTFIGHNGTAFNGNSPSQIRAVVDSTYTANSTVIPMNFEFQTVDGSNVFRTTGFYSNGVASFPGNINTTSTVNAGNIIATTNSNAANVNTTNLTVTGVSNLGANANVIITGGNTGDVLTTNGSGNLSWTPPASGGAETFNVFLLAGM